MRDLLQTLPVSRGGRIVSIIICVCRCSISSAAPTDRSNDGGKRWSVAKRLGLKPAPVVTTRESSDGLGPSPAVAAIRRGTSAHSDKSEEGPCLFEPSPVAVAVTSARELSEAKSAASTKTHFTAKSAGDATSTKFAAVIVPPIRAAIRTLTIARENPPRKRQKQSHGNQSCTLGKRPF